MDFEELCELIDGACWSARRYGHDDLGLDGFAVNYDGEDAAEDEHDLGRLHPEAHALAVILHGKMNS